MINAYIMYQTRGYKENSDEKSRSFKEQHLLFGEDCHSIAELANIPRSFCSNLSGVGECYVITKKKAKRALKLGAKRVSQPSSG